MKRRKVKRIDVGGPEFGLLTRVESAFGKLIRSRRRLKMVQGRIARRNARRSVFAQLGALGQALDRAYPRIAREPKDQRLKALVEQVEQLQAPRPKATPGTGTRKRRIRLGGAS